MSADEQPMMAFRWKTSPTGFALLWMTAIVCTAMLGGCGENDNASSQVAARVNDDEITIHQINEVLQHNGITGETVTADASKRVLDKLIDEQLLVQQAQRKKLDRDPAVMRAIEEAKRQILSQAYLERMVYSQNPPTPEETKAFYDSHPELFAKRKTYKFTLFTIPKEKFNDSLKPALDSAKTPGEVESLLKSRAIDFKPEEVRQPVEKLPLELLPTVAKMKVGDIVSINRGERNVILLLLESAVDSPIDEAKAQLAIQKYIINSTNRDSLDNKLKQLHSGERITYLGQFAATPPDATVRENKDPPATQSDDFITNGLKGLK